MKALAAILVSAAFLASSATAGAFHVQDLRDEDSCECDCYIGVHRLNARADADGFKTEISEMAGGAAYLRLDGKGVFLSVTDETTPGGWTIYENADMDVRLEPLLKADGVDARGDKTYSGKIKIVYGRDSETIPVTATDYCLGED